MAAQTLRVSLSEQPLKIHTKQPKIKGGLKRGENGKRPARRSKLRDEEERHGEALRGGTPFSLKVEPAPPHGERRREVEARLPEGSRDSSGVEPSPVVGDLGSQGRRRCSALCSAGAVCCCWFRAVGFRHVNCKPKDSTSAPCRRGESATGEGPVRVAACWRDAGHTNQGSRRASTGTARGSTTPSVLAVAELHCTCHAYRHRYGADNFTAVATDAGDTAVCVGSNATAGPPAPGFAAAAAALVRNVTAAAPGARDHYYASSSSAESGRAPRAYAAAQCWRSLNASACAASARDLVLRQCLPGAAEGYGLNAGCVVRYSTRPFYLPADAAGGGGSSSRHTVIIVIASVFSAVAVIGIAFVWTKMRSRRDDVHDDMDGSGEIIRAIAASHLSFKYQELRRATDEFNQINKLGQGGYGSVYKGVLPDGREVAVKRLFFNTRQWADQFFNEVRLVSQVPHKNLVKLLGCSVEGPESLLVYEYLCNTSLDHYLFDAFKKNALDWERRFEIVLGTAEGLSYLHSASEIRIIHRDIKASNILLDQRFRPKIADFGLARNFMEDQSHLSTGLAGTFGYMAPEYIVHGQLTEKADIYSYGVLVLEIITGRKNHNSVASSAEGLSLMALIWKHYNAGTLMKLLDPNLREQCSESEALQVFHVGLLCAQASPNLRPPMRKVVEMLSGRDRVLPRPTQPPFIDVKGSNAKSDGSGSTSLLSSSDKSPFSLNQLSVSGVEAR
ncbi:cysteine-rich receptor-like protein kinase 2 isoform X1 [Panicum miliaceum]|uniref:Cysteine-rich receptor-like protein kinase 2 isoform X1 n=1 Tax=Panicum miliaceum TaxID=4540 RepID=A0A3L6T4X6_PANMI|nr:cysteine-rich receptor-like protein kinase 2 isoform X1 [Panicum miliaceum]